MRKFSIITLAAVTFIAAGGAYAQDAQQWRALLLKQSPANIIAITNNIRILRDWSEKVCGAQAFDAMKENCRMLYQAAIEWEKSTRDLAVAVDRKLDSFSGNEIDPELQKLSERFDAENKAAGEHMSAATSLFPPPKQEASNR